MRLARDERGGVLVMVALWMPLLIVMLTFAVDVGNWFVHKRHLQMQADAGALAAAQEFRFPCADAAIIARAAQYSGDTYNAQIGGTPAARMHRLINSKTFFNQPAPSDDTVASPPCSAGMIDVKLTETDLPWYFAPIAPFLNGAQPKVNFINAQARVSIRQLDNSSGGLPIGVPDVNPKVASATFINEATGAVLGTSTLTKTGTTDASGNVIWASSAPLPVAVASGVGDIGVIVALGGATSTTCGQPLVTCFDAGATKLASGLPSAGIVHIRGYSTTGSAAQPNAPLARDVRLIGGSCSDPYFAATACTIGVQATVDFGTTGTVNPAATTGGGVGATVTATVNGTNYPLTYSTTTKLWTSATTIPVAANAGPLPVTLSWAETVGTQGGNACKTGNGNKCTGSFGTVQRAFGASDTRSGPIRFAQVSESGIGLANSFAQGTTHNLTVTIGVKGSLGNAASVNDPIVSLRVAGGSQNQSLDCDPNKSNLKDELATGCSPTYAKNTGTACPGSAATLWAGAQPWYCVAVQTGTATNQVSEGMNTRILGSAKPATCTSPNHWSQFPNIPANDPRIVQVFLTPYGSFNGSGSTTVPVTDFATFYVTGWTGQGNGFNNPCQGNGDDPVPNNDAGLIVGHFIKYIETISNGTGGTACDPNAFGSCIAVMTR